MAPITEDVIRQLAGFKAKGVPVTSCYLDVDGRRYVRPQDYELQLEVMIRQERDRGSDAKSVDAMLERLTVLRNQLLPPLPAPRRPRSDHPSVSRQRQGGPPDSCP